jgi:hypothetical protein
MPADPHQTFTLIHLIWTALLALLSGGVGTPLVQWWLNRKKKKKTDAVIEKLEEYKAELAKHANDDDFRFRATDTAITNRLHEMDKKIGNVQAISMDMSITVARIEGGLEAQGLLPKRAG